MTTNTLLFDLYSVYTIIELVNSLGRHVNLGPDVLTLKFLINNIGSRKQEPYNCTWKPRCQLKSYRNQKHKTLRHLDFISIKLLQRNQPLLKDTPELRTPLYKGHCRWSHLHTHTYKITPELRTPLYKGKNFIPQWCPA